MGSLEAPVAAARVVAIVGNGALVTGDGGHEIRERLACKKVICRAYISVRGMSAGPSSLRLALVGTHSSVPGLKGAISVHRIFGTGWDQCIVTLLGITWCESCLALRRP